MGANEGAQGPETSLANFLTNLPPVYGFVPFAGADHETLTRAHVVQVHKLTDPRTAAFALHRATLVDITGDDAFGREDAGSRRYADLVLDFSGEALPLLRELDTCKLTMRFIFQVRRF